MLRTLIRQSKGGESGDPRIFRQSGRNPRQTSKGADKGIDCVAYTRKSKDEVSPVMIFVKSGNITSAVIRDLCGVVTREGAACGILIKRHPPSKPMIQKVKEAEEAARQLVPEWWRTPP